MKKTAIKMISLLMALVTLFTFMPLSTQAEESTIKVEAPVIEIRTDRTAYGVYESARVTVEVSPSNEYAVEDVFIGASIDGQLVAVKGGEFSKEIDMLTGGTVCRFDVALSSNASGLNIFQKIIMFFKKLFGKGHSAVEIPEYSFNDGRARTSESIDISFSSITGTVTVNVWYKDEIETTDTDGDGLIDYVEKANGLNPNKADTDNDGLSDYDEFVIIGTDPTKADTDGNGINDFDDDNDADGLSNGEEIEIGTSANSSDTDGDGLNDKEELETYYTEPSNEDTDGDGATDGWEVENGFDPTWHDESFDISVECESGDLIASVTVNTNGETAESISVAPVKNNILIDETIPGYLGSAFEFNADGELGIVEIAFTWNESDFESSSVNPQIYCLNEEKQSFYEMETTVSGCTAKTVSTHFSTYILLDKNVYEKYLFDENKIDYSSDSGVDSNNDGISDYVTKLMCDGIIRTGTGTAVFGDYTYEQIQANDDIDGDGIKNGDEITVDYQLIIPDDVVSFKGHYYKRFDQGEFCQSAQSYCESIGGYLCTITSAEEQALVVSLLQNAEKNVYWLGGVNENKKWGWITSEAFSYSKWGKDEPNNMEGSENYLQIYAKDYRAKHVGDWNDASNVGAEYASDFYSVANTGFICEWGTYEVNGHTYTFINSSPIYNDTDKDGFLDDEDPTPNKADVFASMTDYKKFYFDDKVTATLYARQPIWNSRTCYAFDDESKSGFSPYYQSGGNGHSFIGIDYINEDKYYFGFYGDGSDLLSARVQIAILKKKVPGFVRGDLYDYETNTWDNENTGIPIFSVAKTFAINSTNAEKIIDYKNKHKNDIYMIDNYNCTTFAVNALKYAGIDVKVTEHNWTRGDLSFEWFVNGYYGYSPADTCQDIRENYATYVACREYVLKDGSKVIGYEVLSGTSSSGNIHGGGGGERGSW